MEYLYTLYTLYIVQYLNESIALVLEQPVILLFAGLLGRVGVPGEILVNGGLHH